MRSKSLSFLSHLFEPYRVCSWKTAKRYLPVSFSCELFKCSRFRGRSLDYQNQWRWQQLCMFEKNFSSLFWQVVFPLLRVRVDGWRKKKKKNQNHKKNPSTLYSQLSLPTGGLQWQTKALMLYRNLTITKFSACIYLCLGVYPNRIQLK